MKNIILSANNGLKTKFDASNIKFKKTLQAAKKEGIDLNNTTQFIKRGGHVYKISVICAHYSKHLGGRYYESFSLIPWLKLK